MNLSYECRRGNCISCAAKVQDGERQVLYVCTVACTHSAATSVVVIDSAANWQLDFHHSVLAPFDLLCSAFTVFWVSFFLFFQTSPTLVCWTTPGLFVWKLVLKQLLTCLLLAAYCFVHSRRELLSVT